MFAGGCGEDIRGCTRVYSICCVRVVWVQVDKSLGAEEGLVCQSFGPA